MIQYIVLNIINDNTSSPSLLERGLGGEASSPSLLERGLGGEASSPSPLERGLGGEASSPSLLERGLGGEARTISYLIFKQLFGDIDDTWARGTEEGAWQRIVAREFGDGEAGTHQKGAKFV